MYDIPHPHGTVEEPEHVWEAAYWLENRHGWTAACSAKLLGLKCPFMIDEAEDQEEKDYEDLMDHQDTETSVAKSEREAREEARRVSQAHFAQRDRLLCYHSLDASILRTFALNRGLDTESDATKLRQVLEDADVNPIFNRINDLAPELREQIYKTYFTQFQRLKLQGGCEQAPLTRASRQLRAESLPLFYSTCHFEIRPRRPILACVQPQAHHLRHIRNVTFTVIHNVMLSPIYVNVRIDLNAAGDAYELHVIVKSDLDIVRENYELTMEYDREPKYMPKIEPGRKLLKEMVDEVVASVVRRPGRELWRPSDFAELCRPAQEMERWPWDDLWRA